MRREFILREQDRDTTVAVKHYATWDQAIAGFGKTARSRLGETAVWHSAPDMRFGGYYRNARGDVLEMR